MPNLKEKIRIVDFVKDPQLLNFHNLLDTQAVLLKIIYQEKLTKEEVDLYRWMSGGEMPPQGLPPFEETCLILGRGSGKSTLCAAITAYEACCMDWHPFVREGESACFFVIATKEKQAQDIGRNMIFNFIESSPVLRNMIVDKVKQKRGEYRTTSDVLVLDSGSSIMALPCRAKVGRGYPPAGVILDEAAWYAQSSDGVATDYSVYDALRPRMIQFKGHAKMFVISSPAEQEGLVWDRWQNRKRQRKLYFCCKIPTDKMRTDWSTKDFTKYRLLSPLGAERELGAEFLATRNPLIGRDFVEQVLREEEDPIPLEPVKDTSYVMAFDAAFKGRDRFTIAVGHLEYSDDEHWRVIVDLAELLEPSGMEDFVDYTASRVVELYKKYDLIEVFCDQYQADSFGSILENRGCNVTVANWTASEHRLRYGRLKNFIIRKRIELPNNEDLIDEISGLEVKFLATTGQYTVTHKPNGHDDLADVVAVVAYQLTEELMQAGGIYSSDLKNKEENKA